ncbi:unnamed protein product [Zymoseptoria tritici ST99CH_3D7]|uniref:Uncharacterized protein n=1 Tax=Zymoseptoria tritici (strain ST99CH_3D7) TaxID=1276538 RepID=A0A1X7RLN3_ZYMT9|nr:unnamed protein product [Zymoseptoria tritici ST99CH_3D7]
MGAFVVSKYNSQRRNEVGTFSDGFETDFGPAKSTIKITTRQFTGSPHFREDGEEYVPPESPSVAYIGATTEVDAAWDDLTEARYFLLTDEEAETAWGEDYRRYWDGKRGGYLGGLDMFHLIHCLDYLRKALHPDVYTLGKIHGPLHQLHCIDHLRQLVQCSADLTIIPTIYHPGIRKNYIDGDQVHTCRDFGTIHSWVKDRYDGPAAVKPRHPNGTVREAVVDLSEEGMPVEF